MEFKCAVIAPYVERFISSSDIKDIGLAIKSKYPHVFWRPVNVGIREERNRFRRPSLPSVLVQFHAFNSPPLQNFTGPSWTTNFVHKVQQLRVLDKAGIRVPKWTRLEPDTEIDPAEFGENLIIKPTDRSASLGRGITLIKTSGFKAYRDKSAAEYQSVGRSPPLVQQHIRTGDRPEHFRILTFLDRVISSWKLYNTETTPFNAPVNNLKLLDKVASNTGQRAYELIRDQTIENFGVEISKAFDNSVMGIDILRNSDDGNLYALEVNTRNIWVFSSQLSRNFRQFADLETIQKQHNVFDVVAGAIVDEASAALSIS